MTSTTSKIERKVAGTAIVAITDLHKVYKGSTKALQGVNLQIGSGELFGLVGPDGAGKTTLLNIICGVMEATGGQILIDGQKPNQVRERIGYLPQNGALYPELTVDESLRYEAGLHNVSHDDYQKRRDLYLKKMGIDKFGERLTSQLSGGMKQKLALCCALISQPKLLVLDEPTNGLDPVSRRELWQALAELTQDNVTAIVATPFLDEAERCSNLALLYEGQVHEQGAPKELKAALNLTRIDLEVEGEKNDDHPHKSLFDLSSSLSEIRSNNTGAGKIQDIFTYGDHIEILTSDFESTKNTITELLQSNHFAVKDLRQVEPSMENVFIMRLKELGVKEEETIALSDGDKKLKAAEKNSKTGAAISAKGLSKKFKDFEAVKKFDLELQYGEIYGLLGANGAGKTTTIKMLCGLIEPTDGQITLAGESGNLRSRKVRQKIGYMSQKFTLYDALTVEENLEFYASIYEIPKSERKQKLQWAIDACDLSNMTKSIVGRLPRGWKQRIAFGAAVMHEPEILFLDEPTAGVDPIARRQIWGLVRELAKGGTAVLVTTHYLDEAEYCNRMSLMASSVVVAAGSPREIKSKPQGELYELRTDNVQAAFLSLSETLDPWRVSIFGDSIHLLLSDKRDSEQIENILGKSSQTARSLTPIPFSLEDAFIAIVQEIHREQK